MSDDQVIEVTDVNFSEIVKSGVTLMDFWAPWCSPCLMQGPIVEKLAQKLDGRARVGKMNVDSSPSTASRFKISSIPTLIIFKNGQEANRFIGVQTEGVLHNAMNDNLDGDVKDTFVDG